MVVTPNHPFWSFWGIPIYGNTHVSEPCESWREWSTTSYDIIPLRVDQWLPQFRDSQGLSTHCDRSLSKKHLSSAVALRFLGHPRVYMFITDVFWIMLTSLMSFGWGSPWVTLKCTSFGWWHWWPTPGRSDFRGEMASSLDIAAQLNKMLQVGPAHEISFLF